LDELARIAFPEVSGVTADTLKRRARKGQLRVYKPGKAFLSTLADVWAMVEATRTGPPAAVSNQIDPSATEVSHAALEQARATLRHSEEERREAEWERKYDARKAARAKTRPPRTPKKR
jgi:uncharacterized small protein (DUF1192 family)